MRRRNEMRLKKTIFLFRKTALYKIEVPNCNVIGHNSKSYFLLASFFLQDEGGSVGGMYFRVEKCHVI